MNLFSKAKNAYIKSEQKRAATLVNVEYLGGYQDKKKALGNLSFYDSQIEFQVALNSRASFVMPSKDISDVAVEGRDQVSHRVTVTRLIAIGIFAFALKKKTEDKNAYVTIELATGQEAIFHIKNKSPMDVKVLLAQTIAQIKQNSPASVESVSMASIADELSKFAKLRDEGVITQAEFDKKKDQFLS